MTIKRIHMHWSGGSYGENPAEMDAYNFLVDRNGRWYAGQDKPEDQIPPLRPGAYAAHTRAANSHAIGVAADAMWGARERPFSWGDYPLTEPQIEEMCRGVARLCLAYDIPVSRATTLSHAEVEPTLGIWQRAKWDITVLPGMLEPGDPIKVGDKLRDKIRAYLGDLQAGGVSPADVWPDLTERHLVERRALLDKHAAEVRRANQA